MMKVNVFCEYWGENLCIDNLKQILKIWGVFASLLIWKFVHIINIYLTIYVYEYNFF